MSAWSDRQVAHIHGNRDIHPHNNQAYNHPPQFRFTFIINFREPSVNSYTEQEQFCTVIRRFQLYMHSFLCRNIVYKKEHCIRNTAMSITIIQHWNTISNTDRRIIIMDIVLSSESICQDRIYTFNTVT